MIDIRIVCTHDGGKLAEDIARLLGAEQHSVVLCMGRQSDQALEQGLEQSRARREAVLLIWSPDAPAQHYMGEWARRTPLERLAEVSTAPGAPHVGKRAPIIDFSTWRGSRGARAWNALGERLRVIARALEPPKPPPSRAAMALGMASVAAVGGAVFVRMQEPAAAPAMDAETTLAAADEPIGVGGPLDAMEPASIEDMNVVVRPVRRLAPLSPDIAPLEPTAQVEDLELREPTLMELLGEFNPLRHGGG